MADHARPTTEPTPIFDELHARLGDPDGHTAPDQSKPAPPNPDAPRG